MQMSRRDFALFLALVPGIGGRTITRILNRNDVLERSPEEFLALSPEALLEEYRIRRAAAENLIRAGKEGATRVREMYLRLSSLGVRLVTAADAHYPELIDQMDPDPPNILFFY